VRPRLGGVANWGRTLALAGRERHRADRTPHRTRARQDGRRDADEVDAGDRRSARRRDVDYDQHVHVDVDEHVELVGRESFAIPRGKTEKVLVGLSRRAVRAVKRAGRLKVTVVVTARDTAGKRTTKPVKRQVWLQAPKAMRTSSSKP
jgi:hypothetical protein